MFEQSRRQYARRLEVERTERDEIDADILDWIATRWAGSDRLMGTFGDPSGAIDSTLQSYILGSLARRPRGAVVSTNAIVAEIRSAHPECQLEDTQMAKLISEAAMLVGLIPVFDPDWRGDVRSEDHLPYGYGYPAHRPDPSAVYVFSPGQLRTLPVRGNRHLRLTK